MDVNLINSPSGKINCRNCDRVPVSRRVGRDSLAQNIDRFKNGKGAFIYLVPQGSHSSSNFSKFHR